MMQISARVVARGGTLARLVERLRIIGVPRISQVDLPKLRVGQRMTAGARRQHAVEHINSTLDREQQVVGLADAHEIARFVGGKLGDGRLDHLQHHVLRLTDRESADRVTGKSDFYERARRLLPQLRQDPALHNAEQRAAGGGSLEGALASLGPAQRKQHRALNLGVGGGQLHAFVELHDDIGIEQPLDLNGALRGELKHRSVEVGAERDAALLDLAQVGERHDLEAPGVGQDGMRPAHELVQAAERRDPFRAGPQHQVIGVREHNVGARGAHVAGKHCLHGRCRSDRHKYRRADWPARGCYFSASGGAVGGYGAE